jgi:hypothetical protein
MLEGRGSNTFFRVVNRVSCLMEYYLPLRVFRDEHSRFFQNCPIPVNARCPVGLLREI